MNTPRLIPVIFPFLSLACLSSFARSADPYSNPSAPLASNALVRAGVNFEGDGESWAPGQNQERTKIVRYHWQLAIDGVEGENVIGTWRQERGNGNNTERVKGTFTNGNKLDFAFYKKLKGPEKGGEATGTISLQGEARISYSRQSANRLGEFVGKRNPPAGK